MKRVAEPVANLEQVGRPRRVFKREGLRVPLANPQPVDRDRLAGHQSAGSAVPGSVSTSNTSRTSLGSLELLAHAE